MPTHSVQPSSKPGYVRIVDGRSGLAEDVFVGINLASRYTAEVVVRPKEEAPSQKWCSLIAA